MSWLCQVYKHTWMCTFGTRFFGINKIFNGFHIHILVAVGVYFDFWHLYQLVMHQSMVPEFLISWSEIKFFCLCLFLTAAPNAGEKKISFSYCSSDERGCGQRGDWGWMVWMLNRLEHLKKKFHQRLPAVWTWTAADVRGLV